MGGQNTPALLYTAGHGLSFGKDHPGQRDGQGALLCHEFPGPALWPGKPIPPEVYFSGQDLAPTDNLWGLVAFFFACYGAGTPRQDDFAHKSFSSSGLGARSLPATIAPRSFVARLPQRMLSHPRGSALAVIGHVERTWGYSFISSRDRRQLAVFESTLKRMLNGHPVGSAFEYFNMRYAELASDLFAELNQIDAGKTANPYLL
jgi:hypothetical protein